MIYDVNTSKQLLQLIIDIIIVAVYKDFSLNS